MNDKCTARAMCLDARVFEMELISRGICMALVDDVIDCVSDLLWGKPARKRIDNLQCRTGHWQP